LAFVFPRFLAIETRDPPLRSTPILEHIHYKRTRNRNNATLLENLSKSIVVFKISKLVTFVMALGRLENLSVWYTLGCGLRSTVEHFEDEFFKLEKESLK
jgi:hypothetical protein